VATVAVGSAGAAAGIFLMIKRPEIRIPDAAIQMSRLDDCRKRQGSLRKTKPRRVRLMQ
jgi:hypothetical protein